VNDFFKFNLILLAAQSPGIYSASNRNEHQKEKYNVRVEGSRVRPVRRADNLTAICELIV
jgi:hypothetical protein